MGGPLAAGESTPRAVLELFTSQGCSSCPPADALMGRFASDPSLLALTYHVDYWDYLGWKDTLARPEFSNRQRGYAARRGDRKVYTPQTIVNGREHAVGSDPGAIDVAIARARSRNAGLAVEVSIKAEGETLFAHAGDAVDPNEAKGTFWLIVYERKRSVDIARGENEGKTVVYSNVVRQLMPVAMWKGKAKSVELPRYEFGMRTDVGIAVLLQVDAEGRPGPILGAASLDDPGT
jgi:hypothetical protein